MLFIDTLTREGNKEQNLKLSEIFPLMLHNYPYLTINKKSIKKIKQITNFFIKIFNTFTQNRQ